MKKIKLAEDILVQGIDNEAVIVSPSGGMITTINETGALLILYLRENKEVSFEELVNVVAKEYTIEKKLIIKDVESFVKEMKENKIIE